MRKIFTFLASESGVIHTLPLLVIVAAVGIISYLLISSTAPFKGGLFGILNPRPGSQAAGSLVVTGVVVNNSAAKIYFNPVPGAKDYRIYDVTNPNNVKYAGLTDEKSITAVAATQIDYNSLGDGQPHTLVVEAVDQLGPVPHANLYDPNTNLPLVNPLPASAMLGSNKGTTDDGKISTNGQGPYTNNPQVIAQSQPFVVQANRNYKAIPSKSTATQTFFDTFENAENATLNQTARDDANQTAHYTLNAGTPLAATIQLDRLDTKDSMPFISSDHFMDVLFDGGTPGTNAPLHQGHGVLAYSPDATVNWTPGQVLHITQEVDGHTTDRRWMDFEISPANDPVKIFDADGLPINQTNNAIRFQMFNQNIYTLDFYNGPAGFNQRANGTRLWDAFNFPYNGLSFDNRSRFDFFISQNHVAYFIDGIFMKQSDIPAGIFPWANQPLKVYMTHYMYHSDLDIDNLLHNSHTTCNPMNSYWFNNPLIGTPASADDCNLAYPPGYGFPRSDERHWDNMGFEVLPISEVPAGNDFSTFGSLVQPPSIQAPQFVNGASPLPSMTSMPTPTPTTGGIGTPGTWVNVTPSNMIVKQALVNGCPFYGVSFIYQDPPRPSDIYAYADCQGIWKSTDYGRTFTGPINTGTNGGMVGAGSGGYGITLGAGAPGQPPTIYETNIRGDLGFHRSTDGGVSWVARGINCTPCTNDVGAVAVDPYDTKHILVPGHEQTNWLMESHDGGDTWNPILSVNSPNGQIQMEGSPAVFFINTGNPVTTRGNWIMYDQNSSATGHNAGSGTFRTTNGGASWTKVATYQHSHGPAVMHQVGTTGVMYLPVMLGNCCGPGVARSTDYGFTWQIVGDPNGPQFGDAIWETGNYLYNSNDIWACNGCSQDPKIQISPAKDGVNWSYIQSPWNTGIWKTGPVMVVPVLDDAGQWASVSATFWDGIWRYVDPIPGQTPPPTPTSRPTSVPTPTSAPTPPPAPCQTCTATLMGQDTTTKGNWKGSYGVGGYSLNGDGQSLPSYATVNTGTAQSFTWIGLTTDVRALQKVASTTDRIAATWFNNPFTIDVNLTDGQDHKITLYSVDWDNAGRNQTVTVTDSSGTVLDRQTESNFGNGTYLSWRVHGHVQFKFNSTAGPNAVVSGLFFDQIAAPATPTPAPGFILPAAPIVNASAVSCVPSTGYTGTGINIGWSNPIGGNPVSAVDIGIDSNFNTFYNKNLPGLTSTTAPAGFSLYQGTTPLTILPNTTYFVRLYNNILGMHSGTTTFTIPVCPQPTPTPAPVTGSTITITAGGQAGIFNNQTVLPNMILQLNGVNKQTWNGVGGNGPKSQFLTFTYNSPNKATHDQVRVRFTNDQYNTSTGQDVNLWVKQITIDGVNFPSNAPSVFSNGVWTPQNGCSGGNKQSIELSCNGFFQY